MTRNARSRPGRVGRRALIGPGLLATLILVGCGQESTRVESGADDDGPGPVTVRSCDRDITLEHAPERVIFQNGVGVAQLAELDLLDRVIARTGEVDAAIYGPEAAASIGELPVLEGVGSGHGHVKVSTEALLAEKPDLVLGFQSGLDVEKVEAAGIPVYIPRPYCPGSPEDHADFSQVDPDLTALGELFRVPERADRLADELSRRVEAVREEAPAELRGKTAAMLFITPGDVGTISAYGRSGMAQAQLDALGMENVYEDQEDRVTDVSIEDVLERNPDYVVLLHTDGTPEEIRGTFRGIRGVTKLRAVRGNRLRTLAYPLVDPASPLSVTGLEQLPAVLAGEGGES